MSLIGNKPNQVPRNSDLNELAFLPKSFVNKEFQMVSANVTVEKNARLHADSSGGAFTITLPASPQIDCEVSFSDYSGTWSTNNVTVNPNGKNMMGSVQNLILNQSGASITLVYSGETKGWVKA